MLQEFNAYLMNMENDLKKLIDDTLENAATSYYIESQKRLLQEEKERLERALENIRSCMRTLGWCGSRIVDTVEEIEAASAEIA